MLQDFREVIDDETVSGGKKLSPENIHFPPRDIAVQPVEKRCVPVLVGQLIEEVAVLEHIGNGPFGIAKKRHGGFRTQGLRPSRKRFIRHVVFQDIHEALVNFFLRSRKLVEGHRVPVPHQADLASGVVHEELRHRHLSA